MIKIKLEINKKNEPVFKIAVKQEDEKKYIFIKRAIFESKPIKGRYNYIVPIRYFEPIFNIIHKEDIVLDKHSILSYFAFSDEYDEKYYYASEVSGRFMKKWRLEGCPNIFKIEIDFESKEMKKNIVFKKNNSINI